MRRLVLTSVLAALGLLSACGEGYRGDEPPLLLHYDMPLAETLAAMDRVGRSVPEGGESHHLDAPCTLRWRADGQVRTATLLGMEGVLEKQPDAELFRVVLAPVTASQDVAGVTVMASAPWAEATQMKWLLDYVRRFC